MSGNGLKAVTIIVAYREYLVPEGGLCLKDSGVERTVKCIMEMYWKEHDAGKKCVCDHCGKNDCKFAGRDHFTPDIIVARRGSALI